MSAGKVILTVVRWLLHTPRYASRLVTVGAARALLSSAKYAAAPGSGLRQILADVSVISRNDAGTGIQRVVRELLRQLIANPPPGYVVRPVYATHWLSFRYADQYETTLMGVRPEGAPTGKIVARAGDIFLGMDLAARTLPLYPFTLARWKMAGVQFHFLVYDLLPVLHPQWFTPTVVRAYRDWIRTVAIFADGAACISKSVAGELKPWLAKTYGNAVGASIAATWFYLSGEIPAQAPGRQKTDNETADLLKQISKRPSILMVGTVEPRKGYVQALSAFERLWRQERDVNLVIVGRAGWNVDELIRRLRGHPEAGARLIWVEDASDELLCTLYRATVGLLMASEGEGFGLPIVEAAHFSKPVLCRDIAVFREIAAKHAYYFSGASPDELAEKLGVWTELIQNGLAPSSEGIKRQTWMESACQLAWRLAAKNYDTAGSETNSSR